MIRTASCAATLCFVPSIIVQTHIADHLEPIPTWPAQAADQVGVVMHQIMLSEQRPTRLLTETERSVLRSALIRSVTLVSDGFLSI